MDSFLKPGYNIQNKARKLKEWKSDPNPQNLLTVKENKKIIFPIKIKKPYPNIISINNPETYLITLICDRETYGQNMEKTE